MTHVSYYSQFVNYFNYVSKKDQIEQKS